MNKYKITFRVNSGEINNSQESIILAFSAKDALTQFKTNFLHDYPHYRFNARQIHEGTLFSILRIDPLL